MKPIEEMNAMEVCAYLVAKTSKRELGEDEIRRLYDIHCLENETADSFRNLLDEMVEMGILSSPAPGMYRLRRSSFIGIIGEDMDRLEQEIIAATEEEG